jgi:glycosyltransferase involved in cell wall biosynthesis
MRLAWFTHRYAPCIGGAENYGREIVKRFVRAGHEVEVLTSNALDLRYFTDRRNGRMEAPSDCQIDGAHVRRFPVRHFPLQKYVGRLLSYAPHWPTQCRWESFMPVIPRLEHVREPFDAVFSVGFPYTLFSYAALRAARAASAPLIVTPFLHLATPGDPVNRLYTRPHQVKLLAQADTVVVQTQLEAKAVEGWGIPSSRILTLGMAVDHSAVTGGNPHRLREHLGIPAGSAVIGQLGVNDRNKGTIDTVLAVTHLNANRPADDPIHLLLGGTSSSEFEQFAATLPQSSRQWLSILGPVAPDGRRDFYAALDIFTMPSRTDSFGIVFLEAWANAKPVVAAAAGGVIEVVQHGKTGLLVPFGDVPRLAAAFDDLLKDPTRARRLGQTGKDLVSRGYTWDERFASLAARTEELVLPRRSRSA